MRKRVFFDFDGTLIDSRDRLYQLFCELVGDDSMSFDRYWEIKRQRVNQFTFLKEWFDFDEKEIEHFKIKWLARVEEPQRLKTDQPILGVDEMLSKVTQKAELFLVTARQNPDLVSWQIENLGWTSYFSKLLVTSQSRSKVSIIRENVRYEENDFFVGDTGEDVLAGKELGMRTIGVLTGNLGLNELNDYEPDEILDSAADVSRMVL